MAASVYNAIRTARDWPDGSNQRTQSIDVGAGSNRLLLAYTTTDGVGGHTATNATYNGTAMTALTAGTHPSGWYWRLFYLIAPATGTNNIVFTYSAGSQQWAIGAVALTDADQSTAIRGGTVVNASATNTTATWNVTTVSNDLVIAFFRLFSFTQATTEVSGTTAIFGTAADKMHALSELASSTTTTISCTFGTTDEWGGPAVAVMPVGGVAAGKEKLLMMGIG